MAYCTPPGISPKTPGGVHFSAVGNISPHAACAGLSSVFQQDDYVSCNTSRAQEIIFLTINNKIMYFLCVPQMPPNPFKQPFEKKKKSVTGIVWIFFPITVYVCSFFHRRTRTRPWKMHRPGLPVSECKTVADQEVCSADNSSRLVGEAQHDRSRRLLGHFLQYARGDTGSI